MTCKISSPCQGTAFLSPLRDEGGIREEVLPQGLGGLGEGLLPLATDVVISKGAFLGEEGGSGGRGGRGGALWYTLRSVHLTLVSWGGGREGGKGQVT